MGSVNSIANQPSSTDPNNWAQWKEARELYQQGQYAEALKSLKAQAGPGASYHYNLGIIYYRVNQLGNAVAHLEKANRLRPHDPDIQHNLLVARSALGKLVGESRLDAASTPLESFADNIPIDEMRGVLGLVVFVLTLFWIRSFAKTRSVRRTLLKPSGLIGIIALGIAMTLFAAQQLATVHPPAACIASQTIRSGPGENYLELARVEPGMKLRILGPASNTPGTDGTPGEEWKQIRYSAEGIGWIRTSSLLLL